MDQGEESLPFGKHLRHTQTYGSLLSVAKHKVSCRVGPKKLCKLGAHPAISGAVQQEVWQIFHLPSGADLTHTKMARCASVAARVDSQVQTANPQTAKSSLQGSGYQGF